MAKVKFPTLLPKEQPLGIRVVVSPLRTGAAEGKLLYSVKDVKSRRVLFYADEIRLKDVTFSDSGSIRGMLREPMTAEEYARWSLVERCLATTEAAFAYINGRHVLIDRPFKK